jgi:hypothetical protein
MSPRRAEREPVFPRQGKLRPPSGEQPHRPRGARHGQPAPPAPGLEARTALRGGERCLLQRDLQRKQHREEGGVEEEEHQEGLDGGREPRGKHRPGEGPRRHQGPSNGRLGRQRPQPRRRALGERVRRTRLKPGPRAGVQRAGLENSHAGQEDEAQKKHRANQQPPRARNPRLLPADAHQRGRGRVQPEEGKAEPASEEEGDGGRGHAAAENERRQKRTHQRPQ